MKSNIRFLVVKFGKGFDVQANNLKALVLVTIFMVLLTACGTSRPQLSQEVEELPEEIETTLGAPSDIKIGTDTVKLPGFSEPTEVSYEIIDGYAIYEGDMILGEVNSQGKIIEPQIETQGVAIQGTSDLRWPNGVVKYHINLSAADDATASIMNERIMQAIEHWESNTNIRFEEATPPPTWLAYQPVLKIVFRNDESSCYVGRPGYHMFFDYKMFVSYGVACPTGKIIHELGHVIGLWHEQARSDRDDFVIFNEENVIPTQAVLSQFKVRDTDGIDIFDYDYDSIMHYGCYGFLKKDANGYDITDENGNLLKSLEPKDPDVGCAYDNNYAFGSGIGQEERVSPGDIASVNWLYLDDWVVSYTGAEGSNPWEQISTDETKIKDIKFADMNNNGTTDIVAIKYPFGAYLVYKEAGQGDWIWKTHLRGDEKISDFAFGDFNGNGTTDAFYADGTSWRYKEAGTYNWQTLKHSSIRVPQLGFGDFNNNGVTDVFYVNSSNRWIYNEGGSEYDLGEAQVPFNQLGFGDFNGNGTTDIFMVDHRQWLYIDGGSGPRILLKNTSIRREYLHLGDFNGDGTTDVFYASFAKWYVAHGGSGDWEVVNDEIRLPPRTKATSDNSSWSYLFPMPIFIEYNRTFGFGDFNGDGKTDIFKTLKWY